jgi:hypothetical protein
VAHGEANEIYDSLFQIIEENGPFGQEEAIRVIIARTLGLRSRLLTRLRLSRLTCEAMLGIGIRLLHMDNEAFLQLAPDYQAAERLSARIATID